MEEWRTIPGFDAYEVSSEGRVRRRLKGRTALAGRPLKPWEETTGYTRVTLRRDGKSFKIGVHRLVALAFYGEPPSPEHEAAHFDGDRKNNAKDNLRWATPLENSADTDRHDRRVRGERHPGAKLTDDQIAELRATPYDGNGFYRRIARRYGISSGYAHSLFNGNAWAHHSAPVRRVSAKRSLTDEQIALIRATPYSGRGTYTKLAKALGTDRNTVRDVALRRKWKNVGEPHVQCLG